MRRLSLFLFLLYTAPLYSQVITVADFAELTTLPDKKINGYIAKMGFVQVARTLDDGKIVNEFFYKNKKQPYDTVIRFLSGYRNGSITGVIYQTSSFTEFNRILNDFRVNGFMNGGQKRDTASTRDSTRAGDSLRIADSVVMTDTARIKDSLFFQKGDMTVRIREEMRDEIRMFVLIAERKPIPTSSSLRFAEDLLFFDSYESLVAKFGVANVRKDMYYFSEEDSSRCSVLFPDSKQQAIFIWGDQPNDRTLSFLMIGGSLRPESSSGFNQTVSLSTWKSFTGVYTGMRLAEMVRINESDFNFYGFNSDFALMVVPEKKGNIDFKKTGVVLGCLNCNNTPVMRAEKVSAEAAIAAGLQLYIISLVLMP